MRLTVSHSFLPKRNSTRAAIVMDHFGIGFEQGRHVIADGLELPIRSGDVVLFSGASGSGKSSLLRAAASDLSVVRRPSSVDSSSTSPVTSEANSTDHGPRTTDKTVDIDDLDLGEDLLIDRLPLPVEESMRLLSACGLGEAHLLLRTPAELSDGQRYRFRLALGLSQEPLWLVADEFTATLDRTLARVIAFNVRRLADRTGAGFLLATTHEDIAEDLSPDLHVRCRLDGEISVVRNEKVSPVRSDESLPPRKKKRSPSPPTCGSARRPSPTGRTSLGGIIEVTMSDSRGS
jgi:ABC-type ATPase with predicted acetyltransferase domain